MADQETKLTDRDAILLEARKVAGLVLDHIDTMYPRMWDPVAKTARRSLRNTIINHVTLAFHEDRLRAVLGKEAVAAILDGRARVTPLQQAGEAEKRRQLTGRKLRRKQVARRHALCRSSPLLGGFAGK